MLKNLIFQLSNQEFKTVTHYDCSPQHITFLQFYKLKKVGECKTKPAIFQILPAHLSIFSQILTFQVRPYAIYAKLSDTKAFATKSNLKEASSLITIIAMLSKWKDFLSHRN